MSWVRAAPWLLLTACAHPKAEPRAVAESTRTMTTDFPDFGFAGFAAGHRDIPNADLGPDFDVNAFGARPDDGESDLLAIRAAIEAARAGGRVVFGPGTYELGPGEQLIQPFSKVVLAGAGAGPGGTTLAFREPLPPERPDRIGSSPFRIRLGRPLVVGAVRSRVSSAVPKGTRTLALQSSDGFHAGQWVRIEAKGTALGARILSPRQIHPSWTTMAKRGPEIRELHQILEVTGREVKLAEPVLIDLLPSDQLEIVAVDLVTGIGIEDLRIEGAWKAPFRHHTTAISDSGYSALEVIGAVDSWVRRVRIHDCNRALRILDSAQLTARSIELTGAQGHVSVIVRGSSRVRVGPAADLAGHYHGPGVAGGSAGTVFWRYSFGADSAIDAHGDAPYATLFDNVTGGFVQGRSGGDIASRPNHLGDLVLWSFANLSPRRAVDFWRDDARATDRAVRPSIVGLGGMPLDFVKSSLSFLSLGTPEPESLYEHQVGQRVGVGSLQRDLVEWSEFKSR